MDNEAITDSLRNLQKQHLVNLFSDRNTTFANNRYTPEQIELTIYTKSQGNKNNYLNMMSRVLRSSAVGGRVQDQQSIGQTSQRHPSAITSQSHIYSVPSNSNQPAGFVRSNIVQSPNSARINSTPDLVQSTKIAQTSQSQYVKRTEWNQQPAYQPYSVPARMQQQLAVENVTLLPNQGMSPAQSIQAQIINSSPGLKTPGSSQSVQSPATLAVTGVSSPATSSQQPPPQQQPTCSVDDKVYMEKLKQLQKYIEPLSRVIHKFNEDEEKHNKDYLKMKNLRDTLMNPQKRMPWSTLEKCEKVLQSWLDNRSTKQQPRPSSPHQHMCQSIFNTIGSATKFSLLSHTLKRTFGPVVQIVCGDYTIPDILPNSKLIANEAVQEIKQTENKKKVPTAILREITRLRGKYKFKINQNWMGASNLSSHIQFLVYLGDSQSPAVPPVRINTPRDYPDSSAIWVGLHSPDTHQFQDLSTLTDTPRDYKMFHEVLLEVMSERIENTEDCSKHHISDLLNIWEGSIKQACRTVGHE